MGGIGIVAAIAPALSPAVSLPPAASPFCMLRLFGRAVANDSLRGPVFLTLSTPVRGGVR